MASAPPSEPRSETEPRTGGKYCFTRRADTDLNFTGVVGTRLTMRPILADGNSPDRWSTVERIYVCGSISKRVVSTAAAILAFTPAQALACPVCGLVGSGDNTWAYKAMSVMLIMLPLVMIGGAVFGLSRMATLADAELPSPERRKRT